MKEIKAKGELIQVEIRLDRLRNVEVPEKSDKR
jgi:hypothetical protein